MSKAFAPLTLIVVLLAASLPAMSQDADVWIVGDFEMGNEWEGLERSAEQAAVGRYAGKWADLTRHPSIRAPGFPADLSRYDRLVFSLYAARANGQRLTLVLDSENREDTEGWDYYFYHIRVDWEGWRTFNLRFGKEIRGTRKPVGYHQINTFSINAGGWQNQPREDSLLYLDEVMFVRDTVNLDVEKGRTTIAAGQVLEAHWTVRVTNRAAAPREIPLSAIVPEEQRECLELKGWPAKTPLLATGDSASIPVVLSADAQGAEPLSRFALQIGAAPTNAASPTAMQTLAAVMPLPQRNHPFLFGNRETFDQAKARAQRLPWARERLDEILRTAEQHLQTPLDVPDTPGQWSHHYVCKACGNRLRHDPPRHVCRNCGAEYSGWPYDQVIAAAQHGRNFARARDLALAYTFSGREAFATQARDIFLAYADHYPQWPLHNVRGKLSNSAGRVFAQTLDEGVAAIGLAWAYDLIYHCDALAPEDRDRIEKRFLRAMVETIRRNNAGISNWQSWHNAGVAAIGFCLQDAEMVAHALHGKSGFEFQLRQSILSDGFWYEGTAAYHYYALNALRWTAEAAWFAGINYWNREAYLSLYDAPLLYTFPNLTFPAVNDSDIFSLKGRHSLYELAYTRTQDSKYLEVAQFGNRNSLEAFLYGRDELPPAPADPPASRVFDGIGAAILRQTKDDDRIYLHLDYGPHGGGHGHYDKLAIILYALGRQLAPDPGRLAYGAPLQSAWYKQTVAHNTVCVDTHSQRATEGQLLAFEDTPQGAFMQAECGTAYEGVMLRRSLILIDGILVDLFHVSSPAVHTYDWVYHNVGTVIPGIDLQDRKEPLAQRAGYQHIRDPRETSTDLSWSIDFKQPRGRVRLTMAASPNTQVIAGTGLMNNPPVPCPMVIARRKAAITCFASVLEASTAMPRVTGIEVLERSREDETAVRLHLDNETIDILLADAPGIERSLHGAKTEGRLLVLRQPRQADAEARPDDRMER